MATENGDNLVCVFCGSHEGSDPAYAAAATALGRELATSGYGLVYGGGGRGLMGRVARSVYENKGPVVGVMPRALMSVEGCAEEVGKVVVVDSMHQRKGMMNEHATAFIALPGGFGTLEELLEITTWSLLSIHSKPVIVLNTNGYYEALKNMVETTVAAGFVSSGNRDIIVFCDTPEEAVAAIKTYNPPETRYGLDWQTKVAT
ncbi:hypothetical protein IWW55_002405 [Coemansia sp. RSA 2706]|nr:hypothetical protein LPJ63_000738 [Coemansia sp. RSA 2711]KAJ2304482.1 hypothetical protein IWW55_002405 [Coemansia sp. RSA 2706]KAJ2310560.1 hypothetical protein IWW54_003123 [Coemansia sp. RSA 2705]KAJ2317971.1 hypothetical protein IWW52_002823 [Coemansia sp. RSA 2704]KAJ2327621.1 hypothetical protein IWW51_001646 [Coemansia sp. RSA 2702]KAJ2733120.1 hypothetical protein H4R23_002692 [Coemansia sp. Cherry 401B]